MTAGVDEGPVGDARTVHVPRDADAGAAYELLAPAGRRGRCSRRSTASATARSSGVPQAGEPTYAEKIGPSDKAHRLEPAGAGRSPTRCAPSRRTSAR